ncbi:tyrosine-type recombinase/integrase [Pseudomonas brassicacearum]|uniref:Recombinase XerD n=1 Tax=Pseudomonas brassicacearum TaxID=930166 RepID=A0A423H1Z8_9PSED|nr:tyrosine-type recombinase/integrase [Pseudomonas brassicacearum]RON06245.1 recombinase XerD [Pseudomonas brassicacearum]
MERFKLTKTTVAALPHPEAGKRLTVYDTQIPKLAVRVSASGSKSFYVVKRAGTSMAWVKLGTFPDMTVEQARTEATLILGEFAAGADPAKARRAVRGELTFEETFERFLAEKKKRDGTPLSEKTKRNYGDVMRIYLLPIKNRKLSGITRAEVKAIHAKASKASHAQADRAAILISSIFNFAADVEIFTGVNPASRIQKNPAPSRDRFAQADELPQLFAAINESTLSDFFLIALLTGARRSNVQTMTWRDLNLDEGVWRLSMTKNGTPQNVTLSPEATEILRMRKTHAEKSPFVFPGTGKTGHLVEPKKAWATVLKRASVRRLLDLLQAEDKLSHEERQNADQLLAKAPAKAEKLYRPLADSQGIHLANYDLTDLRIHDLRRTLGSWQAKTGASLAIIGKSLNHKTQQATAVYARLDLDPVRQSVNTATLAMLASAGIKEKVSE